MTILNSFVTKPPIIRGYALFGASAADVVYPRTHRQESIIRGCGELQVGCEPEGNTALVAWRAESGLQLAPRAELARNQRSISQSLRYREKELILESAPPSSDACLPARALFILAFRLPKQGPTSSVDLSQPLVPSELSEQTWWLTYLLRVVLPDWSGQSTSTSAVHPDEIVAGALPRSCLPQPPPPSAMQGIYARERRMDVRAAKPLSKLPSFATDDISAVLEGRVPETPLMTLAIPPTYTHAQPPKQKGKRGWIFFIHPSSRCSLSSLSDNLAFTLPSRYNSGNSPAKTFWSNAEGVQMEMMKTAIEAANRGLRLLPSSAYALLHYYTSPI
ncbi:hypothetical protein DFP72DRAFT_1042232 [Ephemerocybe angulata]|uniref:Uncharacterized protein n=1 Tax=Ephemerocybe angulata TaxID=980116 RepID=A0A8H6I9J2_9AGAR|nr:hypothetical protein DFP72DRAFT_1042232 [Tulosesus angulatus]